MNAPRHTARDISAAQIADLKSRVPMQSLIGEAIALQRNGDEYEALCPFHDERTPSFTVVPSRGFYHCFGCGAHGDALDWLQHQSRMSFGEAVDHLREWTGTSEPARNYTGREISPQPVNYGWSPILPVPSDAPPLISTSRWTTRIYNPKRKGKPGEWVTWRPSMTHPYVSAAGDLLGYVLRVETPPNGKITPCVTFCTNDAGERRWCLVSFPSPRPLYQLPALVGRPDATVALVEGEKTAEAAQRLLPSFVAITWPGGSKAYRHVDWSPLASRNVIEIPDADKPGREAFDGRTGLDGRHVPGITATLLDIGCSVWRVEPPPEMPEGWDLADAETAKWTTERVAGWITAHLKGSAI